ncbi:MAG: sugar ABC transporter permease [Tepidisphaeraceae bacterium]
MKMAVTDASGAPGVVPWKDQTRSLSRHRHSRLGEPGMLPYLLILPGLVFYTLFVIIPIIGTLSLSLFQWDGLSTPVWVGLDNFAEVLADPQTLGAFQVSIAFIFFGCVLPVGIALLLVAAITRTHIRGLSFFRFVYFLPYTLALAVVAIAWRWLYALDGSTNEIIRVFFGSGATRPFLGDFFWALPALGVVAMWATFGFVLVMLLSGAQHVPRDLYDAARVDGAGPVREFLAVTLPGVRYELRVAVIMTLIMALRVFDLPLMATQGGPGYATTTPSLMMYRDVFIDGQIGPVAAIAVLLTVVIFVGVGLVNRAFGRD